ncbi:serine hydrolase [Agromyces laixinhei]|uniref:serine hydrolase n=1 Tax=Agromyces laixinhei TaxID=2585717 RepID=UPI0018DC6EAA|nr:serine hydrolase [Agromyces laixinhei]
MTEQALRERIGSIEAELGVTATMHAIDIDTGEEFGVAADDLVVPASIFKVPVLTELCCRFADGSIDPAQGMFIAREAFRTPGDTGLSVFLDDVTLSVRDLAVSMMSVSDNRATDILIDLLGLDAINERSRRLGLEQTVLVEDCAGLFRTMVEDAGVDVDDPAWQHPDDSLRERLAGMRVLDASATNRTTPREVTASLALLWDEGGVLAPAATAEARRILSLQVWPHRLKAGFPDSRIRISGKTGTLPYLRNEAGMIEYPDGGRYAVAVFVRETLEEPRNIDADRSIGLIGRAVVDELRSRV